MNGKTRERNKYQGMEALFTEDSRHRLCMKHRTLRHKLPESDGKRHRFAYAGVPYHTHGLREVKPAEVVDAGHKSATAVGSAGKYLLEAAVLQ